jgi:predicted transcriptional regulator
MPSDTAKHRVIQALQTLPDDATIGDAIELLSLIAKIDEGLRQADAGRLTAHEQIKNAFLA